MLCSLLEELIEREREDVLHSLPKEMCAPEMSGVTGRGEQVARRVAGDEWQAEQ